MIAAAFRRSLVALALLVGACSEKPADPARADSYAVQLPVEPASGDALQRIELPAAALVGFRKADLADLRLFDGAGRAMPVALLDEGPGEIRSSLELPIHPIIGTRDALRVTGVSLRVEAGQARVIGIDGQPAPDGGSQQVVGVLVDTRKLTDPVAAVELDADLPEGRPVLFTVEASSDLRSWIPLAEKTLFRSDSAVLGGRRVPLGGEVLKDRYLRLRWDQDTGVVIRRVQAFTARPGSRRMVAVDTQGAAQADPRELRFVVPFAAPLEGVRVTLGEADRVVPVVLQGRRNAEDAPLPLVTATLRREGEQARTDLVLDEGTMRDYQLVADQRTAGFASPPAIQLLLPAVTLAARFDGEPPYRLVVGNTAAPPAFLTAREIARNESAAVLAGLPAARVAATAGPVTINVSPDAADRGRSTRKFVLWAVLALGTLVLGFAALRLMRGNAAAASE